jgi:hypothetical protein
VAGDAFAESLHIDAVTTSYPLEGDAVAGDGIELVERIDRALEISGAPVLAWYEVAGAAELRDDGFGRERGGVSQCARSASAWRELRGIGPGHAWR